MSRPAATPILELDGSAYRYFGRYSSPKFLCRDGFRAIALPSWKGSLPRKVRFHVTEKRSGKWTWELDHIRTPGGSRVLVFYRLALWMQREFGQRAFDFDVEMEIVKP